MSRRSPVDQPINLDDEDAEHSISQLVSHLKGAYKDSDFTKVKDILTRREARIAAAAREEVDGWKEMVRKAERRAEVGEGRVKEAVAAKDFVAGRMRRMEVRVRGLRERNARLSEEVAALRKRGEEMEAGERRVEDLERRNGEMAVWIFELQKKLEELVGEAGAWCGWSAKGSVGVGGADGDLELSKARNGVDANGGCFGDGSVGRADGVNCSRAECGDLGMKGLNSIRSSPTDPTKLSEVPLPPGVETGIKCNPPDENHRKTPHSLSVRKSKKAFLSSFFKKYG